MLDNYPASSSYWRGRSIRRQSKVCILDAGCPVAQLRRMRVGIDTWDRETFLVIGRCTEAERRQIGKE
jgi:hypothetical protein